VQAAAIVDPVMEAQVLHYRSVSTGLEENWIVFPDPEASNSLAVGVIRSVGECLVEEGEVIIIIIITTKAR